MVANQSQRQPTTGGSKHDKVTPIGEQGRVKSHWKLKSDADFRKQFLACYSARATDGETALVKLSDLLLHEKDKTAPEVSDSLAHAIFTDNHSDALRLAVRGSSMRVLVQVYWLYVNKRVEGQNGAEAGVPAVAGGPSDTRPHPPNHNRLPAGRDTHNTARVWVAPLGSPYFAPHQSPLVLACHRNHADMVRFLLHRGHRLPECHRFDCHCTSCRTEDHFIHETRRADLLKAHASPAFLWLGTVDPFLAAVQLHKDIERFHDFDTKNQVFYKGLLKAVGEFAADIVDECETGDETRLLLTHRSGCFVGDATQPVPRLRQLLRCGAKEVVGHRNSQLFLDPVWRGCDVNRWKGTYFKYFCSLFLAPLCFVPFFFCLKRRKGGREEAGADEGEGGGVGEGAGGGRGEGGEGGAAAAPEQAADELTEDNDANDSMNWSFKAPIHRYIMSLSSHLAFMAMLCWHKWEREYDHAPTVEHPNVYVQYIIWIFILGQAMHNLSVFVQRGPKMFFRVWWSWFDWACLSLYSGSFFAWLAARSESHRIGIVHRRHLADFSPLIIHELSFAVASFMTMWRLIYYALPNKTIGTMLVTCGRCMRAYSLYVLIMGCIILAFSFGVSTIYNPYNKESNGFPQTTGLMEGYVKTVSILYWAFYGYLPPHDITTDMGKSGPMQEKISHYGIKYVGESLLAIYHMVLIISLLNICVALMLRTAETVQANAHVEWLFEKAEMQAEYLERETCAPPPINLVIIGWQIITFVVSKIQTERACLSTWPWDWKLILDGSYPSEFAPFIRKTRSVKKSFPAELKYEDWERKRFTFALLKDDKDVMDLMRMEVEYQNMLDNLFRRYAIRRKNGLETQRENGSTAFAVLKVEDEGVHRRRLSGDPPSAYSLPPSPQSPPAPSVNRVGRDVPRIEVTAVQPSQRSTSARKQPPSPAMKTHTNTLHVRREEGMGGSGVVNPSGMPQRSDRSNRSSRRSGRRSLKDTQNSASESRRRAGETGGIV